jgi:hypothetical protein
VSQRHARALPAHFQAEFAQTSADKTHKEMLTKLQFRQGNFLFRLAELILLRSASPGR